MSAPRSRFCFLHCIDECRELQRTTDSLSGLLERDPRFDQPSAVEITDFSFLPRNALQCICAVLGSHVVYVRLCLSVTLVDCDHIGWKSWKLIARTISPIHSLFVAKRRST